MRIRGGYLILLVLLPMSVAAGKAVSQQLQTLELQHAEGKRAANGTYTECTREFLTKVSSSCLDYGPWIQISSAVLQLVPDEQTQLLLLQTHEGPSTVSSVSTASILPNWHHIPGLPLGHEPRHKVSDNLDFERQQTTHYVKSHGR
ncbi:uncharacterized protein LOC132795631 [Drosophila nasuta]|uniref:uncharacterized protein LOC132795631 n=1 Tax=Drosophila nasuta TaxID=42062 RepID=UPI00295EF0CE|nr:uncharacterized protein LOC132795631 [Drosophila nasuta]